MQKSRSAGHAPQITFTADFHELVQGEMRPGPCVLRYDPMRLLRPEEMASLSGGTLSIAACVNFHPLGGHWEQELKFKATPLALTLADPAGQGLMLETKFDLPAGCEELECWFNCVSPSGEKRWDSRMGKNFWLRFPARDLTIKKAKVKSSGGKAPTDQLDVAVESPEKVDSLAVRWRCANLPSLPRQECPLVSAVKSSKKLWTPQGIPVPSGATVVFDLVYTIGGKKFTDDNEGSWYLAD